MNFNGTFTQVIHELVQQVMPSLVMVRGHRFGAGAGIVWDADGLILTNNHVVGRHTPIVVLQDDREYESRLLARDPDVDLALLSIDSDRSDSAQACSPFRRASVKWSLPSVIRGDSVIPSRAGLSVRWSPRRIDAATNLPDRPLRCASRARQLWWTAGQCKW